MILIQHTSERKMWQHDTSLSLQAKGLMLVLTTCIENNSKFDVNELLGHFTNSHDAMRSAAFALRYHDYLRISRIRAEGSRFVCTVWEVFDEPSAERLNAEAQLILNGQSLQVQLNTHSL